MRPARLLAVAVLAAATLAAAALASTPIPTSAEGGGTEPTAGGGSMIGQTFTARYAIAQLDIDFSQLQIYVFEKPVACSDVFFAAPPFVAVTVDTAGKPIIVGRPSLQNGVSYVQVDFHPAHSEKYYAIQPGASITITKADPSKNGVWHGRLTVKRQRFEGKTFAYSGTSPRTGAARTDAASGLAAEPEQRNQERREEDLDADDDDRQGEDRQPLLAEGPKPFAIHWRRRRRRAPGRRAGTTRPISRPCSSPKPLADPLEYRVAVAHHEDAVGAAADPEAEHLGADDHSAAPPISVCSCHVRPNRLSLGEHGRSTPPLRAAASGARGR